MENPCPQVVSPILLKPANENIKPYHPIRLILMIMNQVAPALVVSGAKNIIDEGQNAEGGGESDNESTDEEEEDDDDEVFSPEEDRANMSIVRFGTVDSRRISTDYYSYFTAPPGISAGRMASNVVHIINKPN